MMTFVKANFVPTLIILTAATVVILAALPLAQTDWANGLRSGFGGEGTEQTAEAEGDKMEGGDTGVLVYVAPLIKVTLMMGIGGLLTAPALGAIKLVSKGKRTLQKGKIHLSTR